MAPPTKAQGKYMLQRYLQNLTEQEQELQSPSPLVGVNGEEEANDVTYFVDEDGRYYYQQPGEDIVSLPTGVAGDNEGMARTETTEEVSRAQQFQTVSLVPSEGANGDISYVLVVEQDDTTPVIKVDQTENENDDGEEEDDVYNFEEEAEVEAEEADEDMLEVAAVVKKTRRRGRGAQYTCGFCSYTTPKRYLLQRHLNTHSEERPHTCNVCERGFKTLASLTNHVNMHNGVKPHICKYCNTPFTTSGELIRHTRYRHTHEKPHKCTDCDYASVELSKLRRHMRCHTGERPYQCPHCTYASPDAFKLKRHIRTHTGERPYKCDYCGMAFTQSNSLKTHKLIHNVADKPVYACELCPTKCGRKTDLRIHVQNLHSSDTPLKCKRCGKTFPDRYSCKVHNKTHEGEKCFKCDVCMYATTTLRHLKSHMLKHTDEKPFACEHCDQAFRQMQLLRRHENLYHNPEYVPKPAKEKTHVCQECNRMFAHKGNLIRHLAIHDPESGHREKALALKLGREKRVLYIDQPIEDGEESADEEEEVEEEEEVVERVSKVDLSNPELKRGEVVTVDDGEGQQYLVLEVIQLEDGTEQQVVVAPDHFQMHNADDEEEEDMTPRARPNILKPRKPDVKVEKDVDACFGFDEIEEEETPAETFKGKVVRRSVRLA